MLELVNGEDLAERIRRGPVPIDEARPIAKQIADALERAHEQGITYFGPVIWLAAACTNFGSIEMRVWMWGRYDGARGGCHFIELERAT